ncbi:MAG: hypothetical protein K8F36_12195 [Melioribacteraceae bacterium]|nr:hypothetical protein [Melioribacteraceae bacterium]MCO6472988.1 hypothetical protein [Melioribacteraceae bacterium]MDD3557147.1 hypothetical protein [Melioribacteraceae bacterium]GJQ64259.1 MAG: hypothetical protein SCALA702_33120 [Melioribacteraceae bacterium]
MRCEKCDVQNKRNANYCENCGAKLSSSLKKGSKPLRRYKNRNNQNIFKSILSIKSLWVFLALFFGVLLIITIVEKNSPRSLGQNEIFLDQKSSDPAIEASVFDVASNFVCGCGSCGEESLDECKCNFAVEERQFIRDYLEANQDKENVIFAVNEKYGGLKTDINVGKSIKPTDIIIPESDFKLVATFNDRLAIYSQFQCPCGQCGIDELKDCTCNHKNGAVEVKGYIDSQIALNLYSIDEIVSQVAIKYGGKKL